MAEKMSPGTLNTGHQQKVVTNIYGVQVPMNLMVYRYDVTIQAVKVMADETEKTIDLTKKAKSE